MGNNKPQTQNMIFSLTEISLIEKCINTSINIPFVYQKTF